jgi:replication factor C subunit 1
MKKNAVPVALGSKEIPEGAPNCLEGLAFLFTGDLSSITRDQATDLVKRYAGRVVSAPSKKTNWVVVGENPGPSKMEKITALGLPQVNEDEFLDMIRRSCPNQSSAAVSKLEPGVAPALPNSAPTKASVKPGKAAKVSANEKADLWTVKYMPQSHADLIGNPGIYEKLTDWLTNWSAGSSENKAALLSGPPGIGKTTMAHLACQELGFDSIEMNASDTRNKKTLHETVREIIDATSLSSMFSGKHLTAKKHVLIMDEVDGMSAGDRGGMAELILLIKKTRIPIICICNDRQSVKVRSLANYCLDLRFRRPDARQILPRIKAIAEKEGLQIQPNAIEELVASTHADIRQILTLLSTYKLTKETLSYDDSKGLAVENAKDLEQGPFDATQNLLGGGQWSRMSMNNKIDQYFIDGSLVPLMIHENYLKCRATNPREIVSKGNAKPNFMDLCAAAADSLSLSDRVDSLIRGSNQVWSLAPLHGVMSSVLPSYYVHGQIGGRIDFAGWLGQNSRTGKNQRLLTEITKHTFLHTRAGKTELRLDYIGTFAGAIVGPMARDGAEGINKTIEFMDDYSVSRDDVDNILDLVLDPTRNTSSFAKIPTAVRSAFTRKYNQGVHRLPYSLGGASTSTVKRISTDISLAEDDQDEEDAIFSVTPDDEAAEGEDDIKKDKMIKAKSVKATAKKAAPAKKPKK